MPTAPLGPDAPPHRVRHVVGTRLAAVLVALSALLAACGGSQPTATVTQGSQFVANAQTTMRTEGLFFAPFELAFLGAEQTRDHYRCLDIVNRAAAETLAARFVVHPALPDQVRRGGIAKWSRGPGRRVAVHVESFRCGLVVGDSGYSLAASDDPGGREEIRGEVVLAVYDRSTGEVVVRVRGKAAGPDGFTAARGAAESAAQLLWPDAP